MVPASTLKKVAIIDDDENSRELIALKIEEEGFEPYILKGPYRNVGAVIQEIGVADYVLCDQRLQHHNNYANFQGTDVVTLLYDQKKPAILITQYEAPDRELLHKYREKIPFIVTRDQQDNVEFDGLFLACANELAGRPVPERKKHRAIVVIDAIENVTDSEKRVIAFVPAWKKDKAITFAYDKIPAALAKTLDAKGSSRKLIAQVNIGAKQEEDLFLINFEAAPEPLNDKEIKSAPSS